MNKLNSTSRKILFIPLDNRPVSYELPKMIGALDKNNNIIMPEKSLLGGLNKHADIDGIFNSINSVRSCDIVVACLDTVAYGGLIPSRRSSESFDVIKKRIDLFVDALKKFDAKVFVFSSIMRISNNNVNEEEKEYWNMFGTKIFQYSYEMHKNAKSTIDDIPSEILEDYLNTRKRNFEINKYYIELQKENVFDTLIFSKDDCSAFGFNVREAKELETVSKDRQDILIKTGADEIPLTLLSRALNRDKKIKIAPVYTLPGSINKISKYEDISVENSVISQIETAGAVVAPGNEADMVLAVNNFKTTQGELVMNVHEPLFDSELIIPEKPYFIADILNANGADNNFVLKLFEKNFLKNFYGYAAWNTTGNTLGSSIAAALTYYSAENPDKDAFLKLQLTRFLDDWAYQANVRADIRNNADNLSNGVIAEKMKPFENKLCEIFALDKINSKYSFPWQRFFEISVGLN